MPAAAALILLLVSLPCHGGNAPDALGSPPPLTLAPSADVVEALLAVRQLDLFLPSVPRPQRELLFAQRDDICRSIAPYAAAIADGQAALSRSLHTLALVALNGAASVAPFCAAAFENAAIGLFFSGERVHAKRAFFASLRLNKRMMTFYMLMETLRALGQPLHAIRVGMVREGGGGVICQIGMTYFPAPSLRCRVAVAKAEICDWAAINAIVTPPPS
jgi:hypothetical protein